MNRVQEFFARMLQKAIGFPPWNVATPMPGAYQDFFYNGQNALQQMSTVYTCCNLLGRRVGSLPIDIIHSENGISKPVQNYVGDLLLQPNEYMNQMVFLETLLLSLNLRGNGYAEISRIGNRITALWPLPYERVRPRWEKQTLLYDVSLPDGTVKVLQQRDIVNVRNFSFDGVNGLTPLQLHAVRRGVAASQFQESFFKNGARPSLAFSSPEKPTEDAQKRARETAERLYSGSENAGKILFLWGGMKTETLSLTPVDAEIIKTLDMSDAEVAAAYGVPMNLINKTDKTATYASAEQFNRYFVDYTLDPLTQRVSRQFTADLLNPRLPYSVRFNLDALLQGDSKSKIEYLSAAISGGIMTPNEARAKLNLEPLDGGDDLIVQSNMTTLENLDALPEEPDTPPALPGTTPPALPPAKANGLDWSAIYQAVDEVRWKASTQ